VAKDKTEDFCTDDDKVKELIKGGILFATIVTMNFKGRCYTLESVRRIFNAKYYYDKT
jgi:hypothetical protein